MANQHADTGLGCLPHHLHALQLRSAAVVPAMSSALPGRGDQAMTRKMVEADLYAGLLVKCQRCERDDAFWYHQRTAYVDATLNWVALCAPCRKDNDEYWNDQWADYYADRL
jgi:hypothetical protein